MSRAPSKPGLTFSEINYILLFSCNPNCQLCLGGPDYSNRTEASKHQFLEILNNFFRL